MTFVPALEQGHPDPSHDELLHLVIKGIRRSQGDSTNQRLPITINLLRTFKRQLRVSSLSLLEQRLMWAAFTVAFFGFLRASEFIATTTDSCTLRWSDHHQLISINASVENRPTQVMFFI